MRIKPLLLLAPAALLAGFGTMHTDAAQSAPPQPLDIEMSYQFSATDNDAEVTIGVESDEAIEYLEIVAPDGHTVAMARAKDDLGLAEIELESAEPSVEEVQQAYPVGRYRFRGQSVSGVPLRGSVRLSHDVVAEPDFFKFTPCDEKVDASAPVTISWNPVQGAQGGYEIIIEQDDTGANLRTTLSPDATDFVIPDGFLAPGLEYEIEMKVGNAKRQQDLCIVRVRDSVRAAILRGSDPRQVPCRGPLRPAQPPV